MSCNQNCRQGRDCNCGGWLHHSMDGREAIAPFVLLMKRTSGRIPTEELSLADWHELSKAWKLLTANVEVRAGRLFARSARCGCWAAD